MTEVDDFLAELAGPLHDAEVALHQGDAEPRIALWSSREPVTLFGAHYSVTGVEQARSVFRHLADTFSDCTGYSVELVSAEVIGDLAYTVTYERPLMSVNAVPTAFELRVTQVYRREDGHWRVAHRHGDALSREEL